MENSQHRGPELGRRGAQKGQCGRSLVTEGQTQHCGRRWGEGAEVSRAGRVTVTKGLDLILMRGKALECLLRAELDLKFKWFSFFSRQEPSRHRSQGQACPRVRSLTGEVPRLEVSSFLLSYLVSSPRRHSERKCDREHHRRRPRCHLPVH